LALRAGQWTRVTGPGFRTWSGASESQRVVRNAALNEKGKGSSSECEM